MRTVPAICCEATVTQELEVAAVMRRQYHSSMPFKDATMADPKLIVHRDPEILGGTPVFVGTRVPVKILFDYLEASDSLEVFLDEYPSVTREQAVAALELAREVIAPDAHPA